MTKAKRSTRNPPKYTIHTGFDYLDIQHPDNGSLQIRYPNDTDKQSATFLCHAANHHVDLLKVLAAVCGKLEQWEGAAPELVKAYKLMRRAGARGAP